MKDLVGNPMLTRDIAGLTDSRFTSVVCLPSRIVDDIAYEFVHVSESHLASSFDYSAYAFHPSSGWEPLYQ